MPATTHPIAPRLRPRGFTLIELLVVVAIIGLISAVALPVILPALNERRVSEAARVLQAALSGARDAAIRANAPRGIRLLPDPTFNFLNNAQDGSPLASNRFVPIEPAPDYHEGVVNGGTFVPVASNLIDSTGASVQYLRVGAAEVTSTVTSSGTAYIQNAPTGWQYNIRQGDKIRFNDSGPFYTIVGPMHTSTATTGAIPANPERYISYGSLASETSLAYFGDVPVSPNPATPIYTPVLEYLNLMNGIDDDGDGWIDEGCDGIDNDGDGYIDPGHNGIDDDQDGVIDGPHEMLIGDEYEKEVFEGIYSSSPPANANYTIIRRPVVSPNSAETTLPAGAVIDLTTWNAAVSSQPGYSIMLPERSRLPVDPFSGNVDVLIDQSGRVVTQGTGSGGGGYYTNSPVANLPFLHFWITEREDLSAPLWGEQAIGTTTLLKPKVNPHYTDTSNPQTYLLPLPQGAANYAGPTFLKGERRLLTLFTRTGQIVSNSIENFDAYDTSAPYYDAQSGTKESQ